MSTKIIHRPSNDPPSCEFCRYREWDIYIIEKYDGGYRNICTKCWAETGETLCANLGQARFEKVTFSPK